MELNYSKNSAIELNYSKKQISPLMKKYGIEEDNPSFLQIINLFDGLTNYQVWAVKLFFSKEVSLNTIRDIKIWADNNHQLIKLLSKGNITSYTSADQIYTLCHEIDILNKYLIVKRNVDKFNTDQRKIWYDFFGFKTKSTSKNGNASFLGLIRQDRVRDFASKFSFLEKMSENKQHNFLTKCSENRDINDLIYFLDECLNQTWDWDKEELLSFVNSRTPDTVITYNKNNIVILQIKSFESSKATCGGNHTSWCITQNSSHFSSYVGNYPDERKQFFMFNFGMEEDNDLARIGFTVDKNNGIIYAHSVKNNSLMPDSGYSYKGKNISIQQVLHMFNVPFSAVLQIKKMNIKWNKESYLAASKRNATNWEVAYEGENCMVLRLKSERGFDITIGHSYIKKDNLQLSNIDFVNYVFLDFSKKDNDDNAIILFNGRNDEYGTESLNRAYNMFNEEMEVKEALKCANILEKDFLKATEMNNDIMLHKLLDDERFDEAKEMIESGKSDVNYSFNGRTPLFISLFKGNVDLFRTIINSPNFNSDVLDAYDETIPTQLAYLCTCCADEDYPIFRDMFETVISSKKFDLNKPNQVKEIAVNILVSRPQCNDLTIKILSNMNNSVNNKTDLNTTPLSDAITFNNIDIAKFILSRPDINIDEVDRRVAEDKRFDIEKNKTPNPTLFYYGTNQASHDAVEEEISEDEATLLKKAMKAIFR